MIDVETLIGRIPQPWYNLRIDDCRRAIDQFDERMMTMIENDGGQFEFRFCKISHFR
jgi:hypothetical protein